MALTVLPLPGLPEIGAGDDLAALLVTAAERIGGFRPGDVVAVSSKVVSKAAGLRTDGSDKQAVIATQTRRVVAERLGEHGITRVVESVAGPVMAAAGVDGSNVGADGGLLLLPADPDAAASDLLARLLAATGMPRTSLAVVVTDTAGRAWRAGQVDFALGSAGLTVLVDHRGGVDADGRPLVVTARAIADEIAAAADLVKGKADHVPVAVVRGIPAGLFDSEAPGAGSLVRTGEGDWFALGHHEAVRAALGIPPASEAALEVGLLALRPESLPERLARVVRLVLRDAPDAGIDVETQEASAGVTVSAHDPYVLGRLVARFEVAAAGEALLAEAAPPVAGTVRLQVTERPE